MNTIRTTPSTLSLPSTPNTAPVTVVQGPSSALGRISIGQLLEATVTSQTAKNTFQVQTTIGKFVLQSALNMPKGSTLVLQLVSQSPFKQFQINSLNGSTPLLKKNTQGDFTVKTSQAQGSSATKLAVGNVLVATLMRPLPKVPNTMDKAPTKELTSPVTATLVSSKGKGLTRQNIDPLIVNSIKSSINTAAKTSGTLKNQTGTHNINVIKDTSLSTTKVMGQLQVGSQIEVKVKAIQLPNLAAASAAPTILNSNTTEPTLSAGATLKGAVTGSTALGHPIVQTRSGVFVLTTKTYVPHGTTISLDVVNAPTAPIKDTQVTPALYESLFRSRKWPALEQAFQALEEVRPVRAQKLNNAIIPRPGGSLTSSLIFFLSALKGGDLNSWMGEKALRLIERNQPNVVGRIREDFTTLSRIAEEPASGDWRVALIPINSGDGIQQLRLLLRQNEEEADEDRASDTRFVIDVELSRFGRIQMDGLVRDRGRFLDLIVRSDTHLEETIQNNIRSIFRETSDLTGLKGGINFQAAPADFINIPDPENVHDVGLVV